MKHRKPRREDWRKKPAKRRLHPWSNAQISINTNTGRTTVRGVNVVEMEMHHSLDRSRSLCVDELGNVYYDSFDFGRFYEMSTGLRMRDFTKLQSPKNLSPLTVTLISDLFNATTEQIDANTYRHTFAPKSL